MSQKIGSTLVITTEEPGLCEDCGETAELRPYGPGRTNVCIDCAMKTPEILEALMTEKLSSDLRGCTSVVGPEGQLARIGHVLEDCCKNHPGLSN
jgi:hypothetical protein